jgi:hypothetical protein
MTTKHVASTFLDKGLTPVLLTLLIGSVAYWGRQADASRSLAIDRVQDLEKWQAEATADRWSSSDQLTYVQAERDRDARLWTQFLETTATISKELSRHKAEDHPPGWFVREVRNIEADVKEHDAVLARILEKLARIETAVVPQGAQP